MTYRVLLSPHAAKAFRRIPGDPGIRIRKAIDGLAASPMQGPQTKRLKGLLKDYYRSRVGDYRILCVVSRDRHEVFVDYIQHRRDVYRRRG